MGLTLQFAIGDRSTLINSAKNFDFEFFDKLRSEDQLADFSLHLSPNDLNLLVNAATELRQIPNFGLRENLDTKIYYFDTEENGAYWVDAKIKVLFSNFDKSDALLLTKKWFDKMNIAHDDDLEVTGEAIASVQSFISICKDAEKNNLDMVHTWFL